MPLTVFIFAMTFSCSFVFSKCLLNTSIVLRHNPALFYGVFYAWIRSIVRHPLENPQMGWALIFRPSLCVMAKRLRDVCALPKSECSGTPDALRRRPRSAKPIKGRKAHAAMIQKMISVFPDIHVHNDPYPIQFGSGGWITVITRATGTFTGEMKLSAVSCFRQS
jgi:hypothetical protein